MMGRVFDDIREGLNQAIDYERGKGKAKITVVAIFPIDNFSREEIRAIRIATGLTQVSFAKFMGVSTKTVEAWESGRNHPEGAACRLLSMTKNDPTFPIKSGIVVSSAA